MVNSNKNLATTYLKAMVDGDVKLMESVLADDFIAVDRGRQHFCIERSREEVVAFTAAVPALFKERLRFEYESITAEEDRVICQVNGFSVLADGREYNNEYVYIFRIKNGMITRLDDYFDTQLAGECVFKEMNDQNVK